MTKCNDLHDNYFSHLIFLTTNHVIYSESETVKMLIISKGTAHCVPKKDTLAG